jgi:regulator of replication initiation timing
LNRNDIQDTLIELQSETDSLSDPDTKDILKSLFNLIDHLSSENEALREENQHFKDEINRLKGEQGKPDIKKNTQQADHSSEQERKQDDEPESDQITKKKKRQRKSKLAQIKIDREQICPIDKSILPEDAQRKGFSDLVIQDIKIVTDNVRYRREMYYSPSTGKTYLGKLPADVEGKGEYGVGVRSLIPLLKSECHLSESCILDFFQNFGIEMSSAYISNQWTKGYDDFHQEKAAIFEAGLSSTSYQQIDDTSARVKGQNHSTQIVCNPFYSAYFTTERKDRLTVLDVFRGFAPRQFLYNTEAISLLDSFKLAKKIRRAVDAQLDIDKIYDENEFNSLLDNIKPRSQQRTRIMEACAIAAYREQKEKPLIKILMCDDAPQFKLLTEELTLCWIHDGRHYKKLNPVVPQHKILRDDFLTQYWQYYQKLKDYKEAPDPNRAIELEQQYDALFSTQTGYQQLDDRIAKTYAKRKELLLVLKYPELPLHNNASELSARVQARARDVSLHTMSESGTKIKDTFMTISQTAKKLNVRTYDYIRDRVSGEFKLPSLAQLIAEKSQGNFVTP